MPSRLTSRLKAGRRISGTRKARPSCPPVSQLSCDARIANALATASVIIAKKIARTRSENRPMRNANATASTMPSMVPARGEPHAGSQAEKRKPRPIAADAEEHGVGERHDARIAEQQVVACREHDEVADL